MKSFFIFIGGFVLGILTTFLFLYVISYSDKPNDGLIGLSKFNEKGVCIPTKKGLDIFQVVKPNMALNCAVPLAL